VGVARDAVLCLGAPEPEVSQTLWRVSSGAVGGHGRSPDAVGGVIAARIRAHAAVLVPNTGELSVSKLRMEPVEVVWFLEGLGAGVRAVYEAGPTGLGSPGWPVITASTCGWWHPG
jgi:hypothetical protein